MFLLKKKNYMKEGVDISVEDFYQMMADRAGTFPKTSMPSVQDYVDVFEKYVKTVCRFCASA